MNDVTPTLSDTATDAQVLNRFADDPNPVISALARRLKKAQQRVDELEDALDDIRCALMLID